MNPDKVLCSCRKVTKGDVLAAMKKGSTSFKALREATGAGAKCGKCEEEVRAFMKKHQAKKAK